MTAVCDSTCICAVSVLGKHPWVCDQSSQFRPTSPVYYLYGSDPLKCGTWMIAQNTTLYCDNNIMILLPLLPSISLSPSHCLPASPSLSISVTIGVGLENYKVNRVSIINRLACITLYFKYTSESAVLHVHVHNKQQSEHLLYYIP